MCGIAGLLGDGVAELAPAADLLGPVAYRGLDGSGVWEEDGRVRLAHTRLGIVDLVGGTQPMTCTDDRCIIVFNGEIYNYLELQTDYRTRGARFRTSSDTEVILEGFKLKGPEVVRDLNGMFAFAIWDTRNDRLFLARDRLGKKPLFWTRVGGLFAFSSTIASFRAIPGWDGELNSAGLALYGVLGGFAGVQTAFRHAHALPAAHWMQVSPGGIPSPQRYWSLDYTHKSCDGLAKLEQTYEELLTDALRIRLRSDVPVGMSFSGGVDSGTLAALAKRHCGVDLNCYTIDYESPDSPSAEADVARKVARRLAVPHEFINYDYRSDLLSGLETVYPLFDQPCQQLAQVYSKRLYDVMKSRCTVVLTGNGADEIFTGYSGDEALLTFDRTRRRIGRLPRALLRVLPADWRLRWNQASLCGMRLPEWWRGNMLATAGALVDDPDTLCHCAEILQTLADEMADCGVDTMLDFKMHIGLSVAAADANYRLPDITGYAAQVEVRSPFLDYRVVEFAACLPHRYKVGSKGRRRYPKYLPRRFYEQHVGAEIAWGPKRGMGANLRWDISMSDDPIFRQWFMQGIGHLPLAGIDAASFMSAFEQYRRDLAAGRPLYTAGTVMNGAMLGHWLRLTPALLYRQ